MHVLDNVLLLKHGREFFTEIIAHQVFRNIKYSVYPTSAWLNINHDIHAPDVTVPTTWHCPRADD